MSCEPEWCVVAIQEEGSEIYVERNIQSRDKALAIKEQALEDYPEFQRLWIEYDPYWVAMRDMYEEEDFILDEEEDY